MSRYAHENLDDLEWRYEEERERQAYEESQRADYEYSQREWYRQQRRRYGKESARRRKMFGRAYQTLRVIQRIAGKPPASAVAVRGLNRSGQSSGWYVDIGGSILEWTPRGGYRQEEYDPLPF